MPSYLHPGVYVEEIPSGVRPIEGVSTSTAAFVGFTTQGPLAEPTLIFKWDAYDAQFGGIQNKGKDPLGDPMGLAVSNFFLNGGTAAYIVRIVKDETAQAAEGYLEHPKDSTKILKFSAVNPGEWGRSLQVEFKVKKDFPNLFVLKVGVPGPEDEMKELETFSDLTVADENAPNYIEDKVNDASKLIRVEVQDISKYMLGVSISQDLIPPIDFITDLNGKEMTVSVDVDAVDKKDRVVSFAADEFDGDSQLNDVASVIQEKVRGQVTAHDHVVNFTCTVQENTLVLTSGSRRRESSVKVTGPPEDAKNAAKILKLGKDNDGIERTGEESVNLMLSGISGEAFLGGGSNGEPPLKEDYVKIFSLFEKYRDINIICLPGKTWDTTKTDPAIIDAAVAHAEKMKSRMVIIDPPPDEELKSEIDVVNLDFKPKTYSVVYYPWPKVANCFYNPETNPGVPKTLLVAPSAFAAGIWAKIDGRRGVWKAPAGLETSLLGVADLQFKVEDGEQDQLNPQGINCLRMMPGFGPVIWGTRTLATKADPEWRYVPVRRTAIMIEQSIYNGIQWAVFEPNDHNLWASLRTNIGAFMDGLFRAGAFQGKTASEAYFVRCGKGDTMTQDDIDRGMVIVIVGFAPLKPAEFVIVRIQQKVAQQ